jgi:hypothetical protein
MVKRYGSGGEYAMFSAQQLNLEYCLQAKAIFGYSGHPESIYEIFCK